MFNRPFFKLLLVPALVVYVLGIIVLAVHYKFPYRPAALALKSQIEAMGPLRLSFDGPRPGWPLTIYVDRLTIGLALPEGNWQVLKIDQLRLKLSPFSLIFGKFRMTFTWRSGPGRTTGHLEYQVTGERDLKIELDELDLPGLTWSDPQGQGSLQGRLRGKMTIIGQGEVIPTGGYGAIDLGPGKLEGLKVPNLPISNVDFDKLEARFKMDKQQVTIEKLEMDGPQGAFTLQGWMKDYRRPQISLTGQARLGPIQQPLARGDLRLTGPLTQPVVSVTGLKGPGGVPGGGPGGGSPPPKESN